MADGAAQAPGVPERVDGVEQVAVEDVRTAASALLHRRDVARLPACRPGRRRRHVGTDLLALTGRHHVTPTKHLQLHATVKKVKFSHTRYRALGPEPIPVHRQSARGDVK